MALRNIGWSCPSHRAAVIAAGAVPVLAAALATHDGDARQKGHEALEALGYTDAGAKKKH